MRELGLGSRDALVALSASGRTPYALAGIEHARGPARDDRDHLRARLTDRDAAEIAIVAVVGPEVIAGSTRMKGGLAQKMILHTLSTAVMVKLGRVEGNLMTHLRPGSQKLWRRAIALVQELGGVGEAQARALLERTHGDVAEAVREASDASLAFGSLRAPLALQAGSSGNGPS